MILKKKKKVLNKCNLKEDKDVLDVQQVAGDAEKATFIALTWKATKV